MFLDNWRKAKRMIQTSQRTLDTLTQSDKPFSEMRQDYRLYEKMTYEDFMRLIRNAPSVNITSRDIADIFERTGYDFERLANDLARLIRDKQAIREEKR